MSENNSIIQSQMRVLIISDRLADRAKELSEYFCSVGIQVVGLAETKEQALEMADQAIDFLIIAGYLKNERSYKVIEEYRKQNKTFSVVHWAMLDSLISDLCTEYKIPLKFERTLPMSEFTMFLQQHRPSKTDTLYEEAKAQDTYETADKKPLTLFEKFKYLWSK